MAKLLLVEDEQDAVDIMGLLLQDSGHTIIAAANGIEAVKLLRENKYE